MGQILPSPGQRCSRCESLPDCSCRAGTLYVSPPMGPTAAAIEEVARRLSISLSRHPGRTLGEFLSVLDNQWFIDLLEDERLVSWFQPIVKADRPEDVFAYECLARGKGRQGETIFPGALFDTARRADLLFYFDRLCRQTAIKSAWAHGITSRIFINFNPTTIYNPVHCLKSTLETISGTGLSYENVIFEVVETDKVRDVNTDSAKGIIVRNLLGIARDLGIKSIAEGVETPEEWEWLRDHGADYLQGYLFAKPAPEPVGPDLS